MNLMERVVCIIQARMGSSRLPGKVMKDICGKPMLAWVVERLKASARIDEVVVATTTDPADDPIAAYCQSMRIHFHRGQVFDVLDRFYQTATRFEADIVVRVTADCPLIDAQLVDAVIAELQSNSLDFAANRLPPPYKRTYPIGLDVEVARMSALREAWQHAHEAHEREHVMPYLYAGPRTFKTAVLDAEEDHGSLRWTVDTLQDLEFIRQLTALMACRIDFGWLDVLNLVNQHPELSRINAEVAHKSLRDIDERNQ